MTFLLMLLILIMPSNVNDDLSLKYNNQTIETIDRKDYSLPAFGGSLIDESKLNGLIEQLEEKVYKEPENASIDETGKIISEKAGHQLHREKLRRAFYSYYYSKGSKTLNIPLETIYPKVDSELLETIKERRISQYITYFNSRNVERTHNIQLAAKAINNYVVFPGETFSFNAIVGKRTVDKGYMSAPIIVKGELAEGVGGGICQVSSTLFNAVDRAGVKIIERYSHSRKVPYVPPNRDATVSWYGPDFSFKNHHNQPLLIRSKVVGGQLIIVIYSSDTLHIDKRDVPSAPQKLPKEIEVNTM